MRLMGSARRAFYGSLGGLRGTLLLTGFRKLLATFGVVGTTAPEQVAERLEELGVLDGWSPEARRALALTTHLIYGGGTGTVLGQGCKGGSRLIPLLYGYVPSRKQTSASERKRGNGPART